jgi:hypothetical protein
VRNEQQNLACEEGISPNVLLVRSKDTCILSEAIGDGKEECNVLRYGDNLVISCQRLRSARVGGRFSYLSRTYQDVLGADGIPFDVTPCGENAERV